MKRKKARSEENVPDVETTVRFSWSVQPDVLSQVGPFSSLERPTTSTDRHSVDRIAVRERTEGAERLDLLLPGSVQVQL